MIDSYVYETRLTALTSVMSALELSLCVHAGICHDGHRGNFRDWHLNADTFIQKTKKLYVDTRTQRNMAKLTEDISEVHSIMTKNIQDVLNHGERLDSKWLPLLLCS